MRFARYTAASSEMFRILRLWKWLYPKILSSSLVFPFLLGVVWREGWELVSLELKIADRPRAVS